MYLVLATLSKRGYTPRGQKRESHVVSLHPLYTIESTESGNEKEEKELTRRNFLPDAGRLIHTRAPVDIPHRLETGFWEGDEISSYYDPMVCPSFPPPFFHSSLSRSHRISHLVDALRSTALREISKEE
jgi:hypothetical protein